MTRYAALYRAEDRALFTVEATTRADALALARVLDPRVVLVAETICPTIAEQVADSMEMSALLAHDSVRVTLKLLAKQRRAAS
jgi:hypothetical protein